jgi:hypothetical protein
MVSKAVILKEATNQEELQEMISDCISAQADICWELQDVKYTVVLDTDGDPWYTALLIFSEGEE